MALYFSRTDDQKRATAPVLDSKVALPDQISDGGEYHRHGFLGVLVTRDRVDVGLMIHSRAWLDIMNILNRCREKEEETAKLVRLMHLMPEGTMVRIAPDREIPTSDFDPSMIAVIEESVLNHSFCFFVGSTFEPADKTVASAAFSTRVGEIFATLIDMWKFCIWKPTSNYLVSSKSVDGSSESVVIDDGSVVNFGKGSRVRLTAGLFAGRTGIVQDMDTKGNVKVLVGRVTVRTEAGMLMGI